MKNVLYVSIISVMLAGCGGQSEMTNEEKLAGESEKTWEATKETTGAGNRDRLTNEEKEERITFWKNGNVKMSNGNTSMAGQWTLEGSNLRLHFAGEDVTENFTILELEKNDLKLRAGDGSELAMKPD